MFKFKKGDNIIIISGKNKGKRGIIEKINNKKKKVYIKNINIIKKHIKKNKINKIGKIIFKLSKIDISNISIEDPKLKIITKVGIKYINGKKYRICKKSKTILYDNLLYKKKKIYK
ncbi:MAG: 50S ribosomal protein L24 [Candidatus Shikimatogenerans bostrichidophilus]|nr:MAG: 50S ribosomal protein L24 [Candidatus Shikimatogenerans bostrichidophilus]